MSAWIGIPLLVVALPLFIIFLCIALGEDPFGPAIPGQHEEEDEK